MALKSLRTLNSKSKAKPTPKAVVEDDLLEDDLLLDEEDSEEEEVAAPAKKMTKLKAKPKAKVIEEEEELEDEELDDEDEELDDEDEELDDEDEELDDEEEETPKKVIKKSPAKKAKVKVVEEDELDDEEDSDEDEVAPVKKVAKKVAAKKTKVAEPKSSSSLFSKKSATAAVPLVEGATMKRETLIDLMVNRFTTEMGVTPSKKEVSQIISMLEDVLLEEVFPLYSVNFCGAKFKRTIVAPRIYSGAGGLDVAVKTDTQVSEHIKVTGSVFIGKESIKGKVDKKGNFKPL